MFLSECFYTRLLHVMQTQRRLGALLCIWKNGLSSYTNHWSKVYKFWGDGAESGGVQIIWRTIGQGPTSLTVGVGGDCLSFFLSPSFSRSLGNGSKFIEILARRTVKPKATTNYMIFYIVLFLFICSFNVYYSFFIYILYGFYGLIKLFHLCRADR